MLAGLQSTALRRPLKRGAVGRARWWSGASPLCGASTKKGLKDDSLRGHSLPGLEGFSGQSRMSVCVTKCSCTMQNVWQKHTVWSVTM